MLRAFLAAIGASTCLGLLFAGASSGAPPSLSLTATDAVIGQTIQATAELSESPDASGEISFEVFGPGDLTCSGPALTPAPASASVSGEGEYASGEFTPPAAGAYSWSAHYSGDLENDPASSICSAVSTVGKASPGLTGIASSGTVNTAIHDEATISGGFSPGGEVTFRLYGPTDTDCETPLGSSSVSLQDDHATSEDFLPQQAGEFRWTAAYSGDANNEAASTPCGAANQSSAVGKASPGLSGVATSAVVVGSPITDDVTLAGGFQASGTLLFRAYGPDDGSCSGGVKYEATVPVDGNGSYSPAGFSPPAGLYRWTAAYSGDANNEAASTPCGAANQSSAVGKASPGLSGVATSAVVVGSPITDDVTLAGGFQASGTLLFRAYGPDDGSCSGGVKYEATVPVDGNGSYSPAGFSPPAGLYRWTAAYSGDANNEAASTPCGAANQSSAVGTIAVTFAANATGGTVGGPVTATASIQEGAIPTGQITFKAFPPDDANCSGAAAFSSTVGVSGNGPYRSAEFTPTRVGAFRWIVGYSGDPNHTATATDCGEATSNIAQARPSLASGAGRQTTVGRSFRVTATLQQGYSPNGTITFQIYAPGTADCAKPLAANTVAVTGNGAVNSEPFVAKRPGRYSFIASYSGDAANRGATEACDPASHSAQVSKRMPKVKPRANLKGKQISIRAQLAGTASPSGQINFRLFGPGNTRCKGKPAFTGGVTARSNGGYLLGQYFASKPGIYRLVVGYSGDRRNRRYTGSCRNAQLIRVG